MSIEFLPFKDRVEQSLLRDRLMATLSSFFGFLAAALATLGLYGVISYMVARRRSEIGIRMALGASRGGVLRLVLREAAVLLGIGLIVGTALALSGSKAMGTLLFGLKPTDPTTILSGGLTTRHHRINCQPRARCSCRPNRANGGVAGRISEKTCSNLGLVFPSSTQAPRSALLFCLAFMAFKLPVFRRSQHAPTER